VGFFRERKEDIIAIGLFIILSLITLVWIQPNHVLYYNTAYYPFSPLQNLKDTLFVHSYIEFGQVNFGITSILDFPYYLFIYAVSSFSNIYIAETLFWSLNVFLAGIGAYYLSKHLFSASGSIYPYVAGVSYMYSTFWIMGIFQNPMIEFVFYSTFPLLLLSFMMVLKLSLNSVVFSKYNIILIALLFFITPLWAMPYSLLLAFVFVSYFVYFVAVNFREIHILPFVKSVAILIAATFSSLLYFIYFFLIFAFQTLSGISISSSGQGFGSLLYYWLSLKTNSPGLLYSLLNAGYILNEKLPATWNWKWFAFYDSFPFFIIINAIIPIIAFSSLIFVRKFRANFKNDLYFIVFLLVIGIFAQSGLSGPTGFIYNWLFYHFPPIRAFDTTHLFYSPLTYLGYSMLLAVSSYFIASLLLERLSRRQVKDLRKRMVKFLTVSVVVALVVVPSYPMMDGSAVIKGYPSSEVQIPSYVTNVSDYLNAQGDVFNVLTLPLYNSISDENYPNGGYYETTNPLYYLVNDPVVSEIGNLLPIQASEMSLMNGAIYGDNGTTLLNLLESMNIRYIVVLGDYNASTGIVEPFSLRNTLDVLNSTTGIDPIRSGIFYPYFLYQVTSSHGLAYAGIAEHFDPNSTYYGPNLINASVDFGFSSYSTEYAYHKFNFPSSSLLVDFNYSIGFTRNHYTFTLSNLNINTDQYNYLAFNYTTNDNNLTVEINRYTPNPEILPQVRTQGGVVMPLPPGIVVKYITFFWFPISPSVNSNNSIFITSITPELVDFYPYPVLRDNNLAGNLVFTSANITQNQNISGLNILRTYYQNPTSISIEFNATTPTNFTLVLSNNFDQNWILRSESNLGSRHIVVDGFMNAWVLSVYKPGTYKIFMTYREQNVAYGLQLVSLTSVIAISLCYFYLTFTIKRHNRFRR
jgi:hypothetical protein